MPPRPSQPPLKKDKKIEELLDTDNRVRSPVLWFAFLVIPVILCFYVAFKYPPGGEGDGRTRAIDYIPAKTAAVPSAEPLEGGMRRSSGLEKCDFGEWVGKPADDRMQEALKALDRRYRIIPPGAWMAKDHRTGRINFETDADRIVTRVWCG